MTVMSVLHYKLFSTRLVGFNSCACCSVSVKTTPLLGLYIIVV